MGPGRRRAYAPPRRRCARARVSVARRAWRADDDHRRSQDDFSEAGFDFAAVALIEALVVDDLLHRRRAIEERAEGRVCVCVATGSQAVDVSRTRRRQGSGGGLGVSPGIARRARRRRRTPQRIHTPASSRTRALSGWWSHGANGGSSGCWCTGSRVLCSPRHVMTASRAPRCAAGPFLNAVAHLSAIFGLFNALHRHLLACAPRSDAHEVRVIHNLSRSRKIERVHLHYAPLCATLPPFASRATRLTSALHSRAR